MAKKQKERRGMPDVGFNLGLGGLNVGLGGILKGLGDLVERLNELAESGQELSQTGEIGGEGKPVRGIYGFTVKVGLGEQGPRIEPFGNIRRDAKSGRTVVQEVREPMVDVFEEEGHVLVVAEMPGISLEDVQVDLKDDILTLSAQHGAKKYGKEVLLPASFEKEKVQISCNNGVLEIKLEH